MLGILGTLLLAGCTSEQIATGFLPPESRHATDNAQTIIQLWNGSWIAALIVGFITWGLIIWCIVAYRRKRTDRGLPVQLRFNLPIEIFYTAVPLLLVVAFFAHTVQAQNIVDEPKGEGKVIQVAGKQWSWDFNYVSDDVYYAGVQANLDGTEQPGIDAPTLYLPAGVPIELQMRSRDVVHSFWVPAFLQKRDMLPGEESSIHLTPLQEGEYLGKCAELCGEYHSEMLFNVKVVSEAEYDQYIESLREQGNTGILGPEYDRDPHAVTEEMEES